MTEKYGFVYIWFDRYRKMYYIGCHWGHVDDGYICSSNRMRDAYRRRPLDFKRRILKTNIPSKKETFEAEQHCFDMIKPEECKVRYYNISLNSFHWATKNEENQLTTKQKISIKTKEAMQRPEVREKYLKGLENRVCFMSEEGRQSHINQMSAHWKDSDYRDITARKGKPFSINGKEYTYIIDAAKDENITSEGIVYRLNSYNFPDWFYLDHEEKIIKPNTKPIYADGVLYYSAKILLEELGIKIENTRYRIKSASFDYHYMSDDELDKLNGPWQKQININTDGLSKGKQRKAVLVDGKLFKDRFNAATYYGISPDTARHRCANSKFTNWSFI
jgi:hypothetical protein